MRKLFSGCLILFSSFNTFKKYSHKFICFIKCLINFIINDNWFPFNNFQIDS